MQHRSSSASIVWSMLAALVFVGCRQGPTAVPLPKFDPASAGHAAVETYDSNGDAALAGEELENVPSIKRSFGAFDGNDDRRVTSEEIAARLQQVFDHELGMCPAFGCTVLLNDRPLEGATVRYVPESFLGGALKTAVGVTRANGVTRVQIPQDELPSGLKGIRGIQPGLYRVEIDHPEVSLPARYNRETSLGQEISNESILLRPDDTVYRLTLD